MKIRIPVVVNKVIEAPDFLRPYIMKEKRWFEMSLEEDEKYDEWFDALVAEEEILDGGDWTIVE